VAIEHRPPPKKTASGKRQLSDRAYLLCLTGVGLLALGVRVDYVAARWNNPVFVGVDQYLVPEPGRTHSQGQGISSPTAWAEKHILVPTALHGPLTSFLLVPFDVAGISGLHEHQLLMAVAGTATVLILGVLAGRLVNRGAGLVTAVVAAFYPGLWGFDAKVMSEPVEQLLVACVLLLAYSFRYHPSTARAIGLGVAVGLCVLTRSELLFEVPLLVIPLCIGGLQGQTRSRARRYGCPRTWLHWNYPRTLDRILRECVPRSRDTVDGPSVLSQKFERNLAIRGICSL
jgi:hypothetical protein